MPTTPSNSSQYVFGPAGSGDTLHFKDSSGAVVSWIDSAGLPQGNLNSTVLAFLGVPTGNCTATQAAVNTGTGDFYSCSNGAWVKIGPTAGSLVSPITSPSLLAFDVDTSFKGPNPWVDIREYGSRSIILNTVPSVPGIVASIVNGSLLATLSASSTFVNGDGVVIFGAGSAHAMSTPTGLVATPSVASAMTGTGFVVNAPTGVTTYTYQIVARNKTGGLTAASAAGTTTIGTAVLGPQNIAINSYSRSGAIVTVLTSSPHSLSVGAMVYQVGSTDTINFGGWFSVATVPDNTHYTYISGLDTTSGAATAATGGTATWFNCNHLTWNRVIGAWEYYIYGRTGDNLTLLGVSKPDNGQTALSWDDFGSPMMDGYNAPYFVSTTPPIAATSNHLSTTIVSGAGTTNLILANTAGTTVSSNTILFDSAPTILAAANAARFSTGGTLFIPVGSFVVNSYLSLPSIISINQAGVLLLNDTLESGSASRWFGNLAPQISSPPAFAWESQNTVWVGRANPGIYTPLSTGNSPSIHGIQFATNQTNSYSLVFLEGNFNVLEGVNFSGGITASDLTGVGLTLRGTNTNTAYPNILRNISFLSPQVASGTTAAPFFFCNFCGLTRIENLSIGGRGIVYTPSATGSDLHIKNGRNQGGLTPFLTLVPNTGGIVGGYYSIEAIELDTMPHAMVANLPAASTTNAGNITLISAGAPVFVPYLTGNPIGNVVVIPSNSNPIAVGQNKSFASVGTGFFSDHSVQVNGTVGSIGYQMSAPAAPSLTLSSGGSVPIDTWFYQITALDAFGNESNLGLNSAPITTTNGNQTVTITPPSAPTGSISYRAYRHNSGGAGIVNGTQFGVAWGGNSVDTASFTVSSGGPFGLALQSGFTASGTETQTLLFSPVTFANLGVPGNGRFVYCADCTIANPCASGGNGALAKRLNNVWVCN